MPLPGAVAPSFVFVHSAVSMWALKLLREMYEQRLVNVWPTSPATGERGAAGIAGAGGGDAGRVAAVLTVIVSAPCTHAP